jgi:hypothetical protein
MLKSDNKLNSGGGGKSRRLIMMKMILTLWDRRTTAMWGVLLLLSFLVYFLGKAAPFALEGFFEALLVSVAAIWWQAWVALAVGLSLLWAWWDRRIIARYFDGKGKKVAQITAGWGLWVSINWGFDNVLYPLMIAWKGLILGGGIMTVAAILLNLGYLFFYENRKTKNSEDWLGMDTVDDLKKKAASWIENQGNKRSSNKFAVFIEMFAFIPRNIMRIALWMLNKGSVLTFIVLSILADSFVVAAYFRSGIVGKLRMTDWAIFLSSSLLGNLYWSLRSFGVVIFIQYLWESIR